MEKVFAIFAFGCMILAAAVVAPLNAQQKDSCSEFWSAQQKKFEDAEQKAKQEWRAFDASPKYIYLGTDGMDRSPAFYAPLQDSKYLPEFQAIFTEGSAAQYFKYTMSFGMKDIIRFHGHSCEALYYTAAVVRLIADKLFPDGVIDRTLLRGVSGEHACAIDSLAYITGARLQYGTLKVNPSVGHAIVLQRIDTGDTWIGGWKDGVNSWNPVTVFGPPNEYNPAPHKRWTGWKHEPETPEAQVKDCAIEWRYEKPELRQRLRDLKDNLKFAQQGQKLTVNPDQVREEFNWLQYWHLRQVFSHPIGQSFQIKRVPNFKWEYPHVDPMWVPRLDQGAKWAPHMPHPAKLEK
jgi:hypothetical protein